MQLSQSMFYRKVSSLNHLHLPYPLVVFPVLNSLVLKIWPLNSILILPSLSLLLYPTAHYFWWVVNLLLSEIPSLCKLQTDQIPSFLCRLNTLSSLCLAAWSMFSRYCIAPIDLFGALQPFFAILKCRTGHVIPARTSAFWHF